MVTDELGLYVREVLAIQWLRQLPMKLVTLSTRYSSSRHIGCVGILDRTKDHYYRFSCLECNRWINTYYNALLYLEVLYLQKNTDTEENNKLLNVPKAICRVFLGLNQAPVVTYLVGAVVFEIHDFNLFIWRLSQYIGLW